MHYSWDVELDMRASLEATGIICKQVVISSYGHTEENIWKPELYATRLWCEMEIKRVLISISAGEEMSNIL